MKRYLVKLDTQLSRDCLWTTTIAELKKYSPTVEIVSCILNVLLISLNDKDVENVRGITGILSIELEATGNLI